MTRPLIALDVDGVLNRIVRNPQGCDVHYVRALRSAGGRYTPVEFVDRDAYKANHRAIRDAQRFGTLRDTQGTVFRLAFDPGLPSLLADLASLGDLVWATTWEHDANSFISPLVGLPGDLPVIEFGQARSLSHAPLFWKTRTVTRYAGSRRFVWFDDEVRRFDRHWVDAQCGEGFSRPVHVGAGAGLRGSDVVFAREFLES